MEVPRLEREVWRRFRKNGVLVVSVAIDQRADQVRRFQKQWGITYPIWVDPDRQLYNRFARVKLPIYNVIIDRQGRVNYSSPEFLWLDIFSHLRKLYSAT